MVARRGALGAALAVMLAAAPTAAQLPVSRSASFDVVSLADHDARVYVEPLVFGRVAIGLVAARWEAQPIPFTGPEELASGRAGAPIGREWMLDAGARFYPAALSSNRPRQRVNLYLGALVGLHRREGPGPIPACPLGRNCPAQPIIQVYGVEPSAEAGVRLVPIAPLTLDIGYRGRLITFQDPAANFATGEVDSRLAINLGVAW